MNYPREDIVKALLEKLGTLQKFKTVGREWTGTDNALQSGMLPALYLLEKDEQHSVRGRHMPAKIDWPFDIVVVLAKPAGTPALSLLNPVLDQLDVLFQPSKGERMAGLVNVPIGGLAIDVWIEGKILKNPAFLTNAACYAVVPLHVREANAS